MALLSFFISFAAPRWLSFPSLSLLHFFPLVWYLSFLCLFSFLYFLAFTLSSPIPVPRHFSPLSWCQLHAPALWLAPTLSPRTNHHPRDHPYNNVSTCSWHSWTASPIKMGLIGYPRMSVTSCWPMPCNILQEWRPELPHSTCLISFTLLKVLWKKPRFIIVVIIIIIIIIISFMQGIYTYIPKTNHVPREYSISAILSWLFMVSVSLVPALALLYFYVSTFWSMCVQCPIWLFSVVPSLHGFLVCCLIFFSDWFWNGPSRSYYYWYHPCFYLPHALYFYCQVLIF